MITLFTPLSWADDRNHLPPWGFSVFAGSSQHSPVTKNWGGIAGREHYVVGAQGSTTVWAWQAVRLAYAPDVKLMMIWGPNLPDPVLGVGFTPLGLEAGVDIGRWEAFGNFGAGLFVSDHDVPITTSGRNAFAFQAGGGVGRQFSPAMHLRAGYWFYHISNNRTKFLNPGLNADILYLAVQFKP